MKNDKYALKYVQYAFWQVFSKIGAAFLAVSAILAGLGIVYDKFSHLFSTAGVFGVQGAIWLIVSACFWLYYKSSANKRERLKHEGLCYDAEIVRIRLTGQYRTPFNFSVYAECRYKNQEDKTCLVRSQTFLSDYTFDKDNLIAKVYVTRGNSRDYCVDIQKKEFADVQFDYDFR